MTRLRLATVSLAAVLVVAVAAGCESRRIGAASWESLELEIVDRESGAPVSGVTCAISTRARVIARGTSDETGRVVLAQSFPEAVTLDVDDPERRWAPKRVELAEAGHHRVELDRAVRAALRVVGEDGVLLSDAVVTVWGPGGTIHRHPLPGGAATFGPLAPGSSKFVISAPGHASAVLDVRLIGTEPGKSEDLKSVRLSRGGTTVLGRVGSKPSRRPQRAVLRFSGAGAQADVQPDGRFRFDGLPNLEGDQVSGGVMLVLVRDGEEVYARDLEFSGRFLNVGTIEIR
jgi:hypothetical protein